jgi:hypothetical protein
MRLRLLRLAVIAGLIASASLLPTSAQRDAFVSNNSMKLVNFEDLEYPTIGRTAHVQGVVVLKANLDDEGKVVGATAISGPEPLIPDCLANAKKWRFRPNAKKSVVIIYNFKLTDAISKSGCSHFMLEPPNFVTITSCVPQIQFKFAFKLVKHP